MHSQLIAEILTNILFIGRFPLIYPICLCKYDFIYFAYLIQTKIQSLDDVGIQMFISREREGTVFNEILQRMFVGISFFKFIYFNKNKFLKNSLFNHANTVRFYATVLFVVYFTKYDINPVTNILWNFSVIVS